MNNINEVNDGGFGEYKQVRVEYKRNGAHGRRNENSAISAGGAIIIIIFVVLCLTIFALLSFATSFADKKLADRNMQSIQQYYEADASASEKLAQIYNFIHDYYKADITDTTNQTKNINTYSLEEAFGDANNFDFDASLINLDSEISETTVLYYTPMNDIQTISSEVIFYYDSENNKLSYKISEWKIVLTAEYDSFQFDDQAMNLVDPFAWAE